MNLGNYSSGNFDRGRSRLIEAFWIVSSAIVFARVVPVSRIRVFLLRLFGARVGLNVVIRSSVKIKFPWRLHVGDNVWIGESVWIDNLAPVSIGNNTCISQGVYFCTGNHDWSSPTFNLKTGPITIGSKAWIAAKAVLGPGVNIGDGAVVCLGSIVTSDIAPWVVWSASPNTVTQSRNILPSCRNGE